MLPDRGNPFNERAFCPGKRGKDDMQILQCIFQHAVNAESGIKNFFRVQFSRATSPVKAALLFTMLTLVAGGTAFGQSYIPTIPAELQQVGGKLVGAGATGPAQQGAAIALSAVGNTAIVGGNADNGDIGGVWIFSRVNGVWSQDGPELVGSGYTGGARQGISVAISADGRTVAWGGHFDNSGVGAVWVFALGNAGWSQEGTKLVGSGASGAAHQGLTVSLSADGSTLAEGGYADNSNTGATWVFTNSLGTWSQQGNKLVGTGANGGAQQGYTVALSSDGNTLMEGGYGDSSAVGAAWVFTRSTGTWSQQSSKLVPIDAFGGLTYFGLSVSLSGDGNTAVIGGPYDNSGLGGFWIFTRSSGTWIQQSDKIVGTGDNAAYQGAAVSISRDGSTILEGGPYDNDGGAWMFSNVGGNWTQQGSEIVGTGSSGDPDEGFRVALSSDGRTGLIGGYADNGAVGAVWALDTETKFWSQNISSSVTQTVSISFPYPATFTGATVLTQGGSSQDFTLPSSQPAGSCALSAFYQQGNTCSVTVIFAPIAPGVRSGAIVLATSTSGPQRPQPPDAVIYLQGFGLGPQIGFVSGVINTVAGDGTKGYTGDGGGATGAEINDPDGMALDDLGNLYISDCFVGVVRKVSAVTGFISTFAGNGTRGYSGDRGPATSAELTCPVGLAVDGAGNLVIGDADTSTVRVVYAATGVIYTVAGNGGGGYSGDGGPATSAAIGEPDGVALDAAGNLYISDANNCYVREVNAITGIISTLAGISDGCGYSGDGGLGVNAALNTPLGIHLDANAHLYIADNGNNAVRVLNTHTGVITTLAGNGTAGYSGDGGLAASALLNSPRSVVVDSANNIYITDTGNNTIRKVTVGTDIINRIAGDGTTNSGYSGDGGPATGALMNRPDWPAIDINGNFYFTDENNAVARTITGAASLSFRSVDVNTNSAAQDITISNNGTASLSMASLAVSGPFNLGGADTTCIASSPLAAGGSCVVGVVFAPTMSGSLSGALTLTSYTISLSGTGGAVQRSTITTLGISPSPAAAGQTITFRATVSPAPSSLPYGTVIFYNDCDILGTGTVNSSGVATFTRANLHAGTYNVFAVYGGDAGSVGSSSSTITEVVNVSFTVSVPQTPLTAVPGGSVSATVTASPLGGAFNSAVTMSASGLPAQAVATFTPASVTPGNSGATTLMTIQLASHGSGIPLAPMRPFPFLYLSVALAACAIFILYKRSRVVRLASATIALACITTMFAGCAYTGSSSQAGTYTVTITGSSGSQHNSETTTLVVQ
jgi:hypothetical protein